MLDGEDALPLVARLELLEGENAQLREALVSRVVIEQAKGVLAERFGLEFDQAFDVLRRAARSNRMRIHALAAVVVSARTTPVEIQAVAVSVLRTDGAAASNGRNVVPR